ncbi:MAG TPA: DUF481 domain-containing protein [Gemmatimonadaceae bacterium]|nr:DUF481 domain-containing protein [Gemmatimonadaceae bacterium]
MNLVASIARATATGVLVTSLLLALSPPTALHAQEIGWSGSAEANASLFFGNTEQWVVAGATRAAYSDSSIEVRGEVRADYAETAVDSGGSFVSRRAWLLSTGVDFSPFAKVSPFLLGSAESSLQARIHRRYSAGFGGKLTYIQTDDTKLSTSLALLWERTRVMDGNSNPDLPGSRLRWSFRLKGSHKLDDRIHFSHETFYQPSVRDMQHFTITSTSTLTFALNKTLGFTSSLHDSYDSEARRRGARSNNDGQFLVGLRARY